MVPSPIGSLRYFVRSPATHQVSNDHSDFILQNDISRKAQGQISLDDSCRVVRADGSATFEISTAKKTYYLTADSSATVEEWVRILQSVVRRNTTKLLLGREDQKPTLQGWIMKVKHGHSKRCWCVLVGKMFLYFKLPSDQVSARSHLRGIISCFGKVTADAIIFAGAPRPNQYEGRSRGGSGSRLRFG